MRVRIVAPASYHDRHGKTYHLGCEYDVSDDLAVKLLNHHIAVPVRHVEHETVVAPPLETTAKRTTKPRARAEEDTEPAGGKAD